MRESIAEGLRRPALDAASSMARGRPSKWAQIAATRRTLSSSSVKSGETAAARWANSATASLRERSSIVDASASGTGRGHHPQLLLPPKAQGGPARHENLRTCGDGKQPSHIVGCLQDLLEVVQDQERLPFRDVVFQGLAGRSLPPLLSDADGGGDGGDHERRIADRRQVHEGDPVGERLRRPWKRFGLRAGSSPFPRAP